MMMPMVITKPPIPNDLVVDESFGILDFIPFLPGGEVANIVRWMINILASKQSIEKFSLSHAVGTSCHFYPTIVECRIYKIIVLFTIRWR